MLRDKYHHHDLIHHVVDHSRKCLRQLLLLVNYVVVVLMYLDRNYTVLIVYLVCQFLFSSFVILLFFSFAL